MKVTWNEGFVMGSFIHVRLKLKSYDIVLVRKCVCRHAVEGFCTNDAMTQVYLNLIFLSEGKPCSA